MAEKFKMMKVFTNDVLPKNIKKELMDQYEHRSNDCFIRVSCVGESAIMLKEAVGNNPKATAVKHEDFDDGEYVYLRGEDILSDWLMDNGAELFEDVLVEHSW